MKRIPKYKIGQKVYGITDKNKDAVCPHCGSHYRKFDKYIVWDFIIDFVIFDTGIDSPRYGLDHKENGFVHGISKYEENVFATRKEANAICELMNKNKAADK